MNQDRHHINHGLLDSTVPSKEAAPLLPRASDPLANALRSADLDVCVKTIQDALEIKAGDVAGQCFSNDDRKTYASLLNSYRRAEFIKSWLSAELDDAAERVGQNG